MYVPNVDAYLVKCVPYRCINYVKSTVLNYDLEP